MVIRPLVPDRGDIVWLALDPQAGPEQAGRRPFEVELPRDGAVPGVVLADQVKSLDWRARGASLVERASGRVIAEVMGKVAVLLG